VKALPYFEVDDAHRSPTTLKMGEAVRTIRKEELAAKNAVGPDPSNPPSGNEGGGGGRD
jgi:hypothetical protein